MFITIFNQPQLGGNITPAGKNQEKWLYFGYSDVI
jgi:hypothetical protein